MWTRREIGMAVLCLAVGSVGQLVEYAVSPLSQVAAPAVETAVPAPALARP